jgi:hypothetical protein
VLRHGERHPRAVGREPRFVGDPDPRAEGTDGQEAATAAAREDDAVLARPGEAPAVRRPGDAAERGRRGPPAEAADEARPQVDLVHTGRPAPRVRRGRDDERRAVGCERVTAELDPAQGAAQDRPAGRDVHDGEDGAFEARQHRGEATAVGRPGDRRVLGVALEHELGVACERDPRRDAAVGQPAHDDGDAVGPVLLEPGDVPAVGGDDGLDGVGRGHHVAGGAAAHGQGDDRGPAHAPPLVAAHARGEDRRALAREDRRQQVAAARPLLGQDARRATCRRDDLDRRADLAERARGVRRGRRQEDEGEGDQERAHDAHPSAPLGPGLSARSS